MADTPLPSNDDIAAAIGAGHFASDPAALPAAPPAQAPQITYDAQAGVGRYPNGAIAYLGPSDEQMAADQARDPGEVLIERISNPDAIANWLARHPDDPANKLQASDAGNGIGAGPATGQQLPSQGDLSQAIAKQGFSTDPNETPSVRQMPGPAPQAAPQASTFGGGAPGAPANPLALLGRSADATVRSLANGVTGGFADKIAAADEALPALLKGGLPAYQQQYSTSLDAQHARDASDRQYVPWAAIPSAVTGAVAQAALLPEARAASLVGRAAIGAGQGALLGGVDALGGARGNLAQESAKAVPSMATGALLGAPLGAVLGARAAAAAPIRATLAEHAAAGVDPMLAVGGPQPLQQIAQMIKGIPGVGLPLVKAAARTSAQLNEGVQAAAQRAGSARTPYEAGSALQRGAQKAVGAYKAKLGELYRTTGPLESNPTALPVTNTQGALARIFKRYPTPEMQAWLKRQAPKVAALKKTLDEAAARGENGAITFGEMKALRTDIGTMLKDHTLADVDQGRLKQIYGALSQDYYAGAEQLGGAGAKEAVLRADAYNSGVRQRVADTLDQFINADSPEKAFNKVLAMGSATGRADVGTLQRLMRSVNDEARGELRAGLIMHMGRNAEGAFSPAKFATDLSNMTPEAKHALFGSDAKDLNALAKVAKQQVSAGKFYNHSNSGHLAVSAVVGERLTEALAEGKLHHVAAIAALGALGHGAAHLLASPGFARLVLRAARADSAGATKTADSAFAQYANDNSPLAAEVERYRAEFMRRVRTNLAPAAASGAVSQGRTEGTAQAPGQLLAAG